MNKHLFRLVFNRALGVLQVVAEIVRRPGRGATSTAATAAATVAEARLPAMRFALLVALGWVTTLPALAQVVADPAAPGDQRATVLQAPNGVPLINLTTPSAAGVSRNTYRQFDVDKDGAILNNARTNTQTQLGGWVQGNPWLATGAAKVILNEVNSSDPSRLNGYVEVAGERAQVVIANPAGISCSGCGFLNASRVTLTTGAPQLSGGSLDAYRVEGGAIQVGEGGLDASQADYTDLIARSLELNGKVWAKEIKASIGANVVSADQSQVTRNSDARTGNAPAFALDVGALGGMYAGKITLVGTEAGVGVRNAGEIGATAGELEVTVDGRLENRGKLHAQGDARLSASAGVANAGTISAAREIALSTAADLDNRGGTLNARRINVEAASLRNRGGSIEQTGSQALQLNAGSVRNRDGGRIGIAATASPLPAAEAEAGAVGATGRGTPNESGGGSVTANGGFVGEIVPTPVLADSALRIAGTLDNDGGAINAGGGVALSTATGLDNSGGRLGLRSLTMTQGDLANAGGELNVAGDAALKVGSIDNDAGRFEIAGALQVDAGALSNRGGTIAQGSTAASVLRITGAVDNTDGRLLTNAASLTLDSGTLINERGRIEHAGPNGLSLKTGALRGTEGTIATTGSATVTAGDVDHRKATLAAAQINLNADGVDNRGGKILGSGPDASTLTVHALDNREGGGIASKGSLTLRAVGNPDAGDSVELIRTYGPATAHGEPAEAGRDQLNRLLRSVIDNSSGTIVSQGTLDLSADKIDNAGGLLQAQRAINVDVSGMFDNSGGTTAAGEGLNLKSNRLGNRDTFDASTTDAAAQKGLFGQRIDLAVNTFDNTRGQVRAADAVMVQGREASGTALDNTGGVIDGTGTVRLATSELANAGGTVIQRGAQGALTVSVRGRLHNTESGVIAAEGSAALDTGALDNGGGRISSAGNLAVNSAGDVINRDSGRLQSGAGLNLTATGKLDNEGGTIDGLGATEVAAASIANAGGRMLAGTENEPGHALTVTTAGVIGNRGGTIAHRGGDLTLQAARIDNSAQGTLVAQRDLALDTSAVDNSGGTVYATRHLRYENAAATLDNAAGTFGSGDTTWLTLARISNIDAGRIQAGNVWLDAPQLDIGGGEIAANTLHANLLTVNGIGRLYGAQWLDVDVGGDFTYETGQRFDSDGLLDLVVAGAFTHRGTLQTAGDLALTATTLTNQGTIKAASADGTATGRITVAGTLDNQRGASIEGDALSIAATDVDNTGDIVGDRARIEADTLTNGRDLAQYKAEVDYGEGFIGAATSLELRVANALLNLDADLFSAGALTIAGRTDGSRVGTLANESGRIQAEGSAKIAADTLINRRRAVAIENVALTPDEQHALGTQRNYDQAWAALSDGERADYGYLTRLHPDKMTAAERGRLRVLWDKLGWVKVDHVSDALLAALNAEIDRIAPTRDAYHAYIVDSAATSADNPGARVLQTDTYRTGWSLIDADTSATAQIVAGGDLAIDTSTRVQNRMSQIAAGGKLVIGGKTYDDGTTSASDAIVENVELKGEYQGERASTAWVRDPTVAIKYLDYRGWNDDTAHFAATMTEAMTFAGPTLLTATITAGQGATIKAKDLDNTAVTPSGSLQDMENGAVDGPGALPGAAASQTFSADRQVVGTIERPAPGRVPADNGLFDLNADPAAPFLVTTAPRFAKGDRTSSDYLLDRLDATANLHKRLGDGYYEQRLVMEQILQLTGRRSLTGNGNALAQYTALMDGAANEAARLGLALGAPLTSTQIAGLEQDIVWLVEQEVSGQNVLVPVVYLARETAKRMRHDGALVDAGKLNLQLSGKLRNDGQFTGTNGAWLSAGTLINNGTLASGNGHVGIKTTGTTTNRGQIHGQSVVIDANKFVNDASFDGTGIRLGQVKAGKDGLRITTQDDVVNDVRLSAPTVELQGVEETSSYQRQSTGKSWAWQSQDDRGRIETTVRQSQITGPLTLDTPELVVGVGQREGETIEAALARQAQQPGQGWLAQLPADAQLVGQAETLTQWSKHQEGLSPELATVAAIAAAIWAGPAAKAATEAAMGSMTGGAFVSAVAGGAAAGATNGAVSAGLQGQSNWARAAGKGAVNGAVSAALFFGAGEFGEALGFKAGSFEQVLSHGLAGGVSGELTGGSFRDGALSGAISEGAGPWIESTWSSETGRALAHAGAGAIAPALTGSGIDDIRQGAINGAFGYWFNRQLHPSEDQVISDLAKKGYNEEQLRAVACAMTQCLLGRGLVEPGPLSEGLSGKIELTEQGQMLAKHYQDALNQMSPHQKQAIAQQLENSGKFKYAKTDAWNDAVVDTQASTRLDGLTQTATGMLGGWAASSICTLTGWSCAAVVEAADNVSAGLTSFYHGRPTPTAQNQAWQKLGLSPQAANGVELLTGLTIGAGSGWTGRNAWNSDSRTFETLVAEEGGIFDVTVPALRYPQSTAHIRDAQAAGKPAILTIERPMAKPNRRASLRGTEARPGFDRDEYPPAMFKEGGAGASVRYILRSDNRGSGACIGAQCRHLPDGHKVRIVVDDGK